MKPTIEAILYKYKNVKNVICANDKTEIEINIDTLYFSEFGNWCVTNNENLTNYLWNGNSNQYAEIISYKEETVPVPLRLIKELCKEKNIEEILIREGIIEDTRYVKIPLSEIKNNPNDMLLGKLVRNIADNY